MSLRLNLILVTVGALVLAGLLLSSAAAMNETVRQAGADACATTEEPSLPPSADCPAWPQN